MKKLLLATATLLAVLAPAHAKTLCEADNTRCWAEFRRNNQEYLSQEIKLLYEINAVCRGETPTVEAETVEQACKARDELVRKLAGYGFCFYGHGVLGIYSKDKTHCYERRSLWPKD
jgi:hypothetical protein